VHTLQSHFRSVFDVQIIDERAGAKTLVVTGDGARALFADEGGGHRWQRIPPTEKRGRMQTSTVVVAVLDPLAVSDTAIDVNDVEFITARGSGPGGQNRNKTESCVIATHKQSGISVRIDNERSQHQNKATALKVLAARLYEQRRTSVVNERNASRKEQMGSGMRGDKVRTYRTQDDQVVDHRTGKRWRLSSWMRGQW
jgi:peptide chain release factor 1